jgi:Zn-dependent peptidase ImmA (M78 family)
VRDILIDDDTHQIFTFVASSKVSDGVGSVLASVQKTLGLELSDYRAQPTPEAAFSYLRDRAEASGIFVLLIGNLGSHHTAINVEAFRGFALADEVAPFVVINDQDSPTAWSFTLLHELTHLWLGKTGVSGRSSELEIEKFCNDVAASFLLPGNDLEQIRLRAGASPQVVRDRIDAFVTGRHVSRTMVAYRLYRASVISEENWRTVTDWYLAQWRKGRDARRERQRDKDGGPNYYVVRRHRLGSALIALVARSVQEGSLTPTRASKVLGVKPRSVAPLLNPALSMGNRAA